VDDGNLWGFTSNVGTYYRRKTDLASFTPVL
jgi:hypothetical protein